MMTPPVNNPFQPLASPLNSDPLNPGPLSSGPLNSGPLNSGPLSAHDAWRMPIFPELEPSASIGPAATASVPLQTVDTPPTWATFNSGATAPAIEPPAIPERFVKPAAAPPATVSAPARQYQRGKTSVVWGLPLDCVAMEQAVTAIQEMIEERTPRYVITANLNYAMLLDQDESMQKITDDASMILADGQPLVWRSYFSKQDRLPERVAGSELIYRLAERGAAKKWRIYFIGAEPGVAQRCADRLANRYPGLQIAGVQSPPYRALTDAERQQQRQAIIDSRADILLVAFGQPKGERWIHEHYQSLGVPVSIQLGASFDFVAGTAKRAPKIWQRLGMEWAYRMFSDPGRLVPRYASNAKFLFVSLLRDWRDIVNGMFKSSTPAQ